MRQHQATRQHVLLDETSSSHSQNSKNSVSTKLKGIFIMRTILFKIVLISKIEESNLTKFSTDQLFISEQSYVYNAFFSSNIFVQNEQHEKIVF